MEFNYNEERIEELKEIEIEFGVKLEDADTFMGMMTKLFNKLMAEHDIGDLIDKPIISWTEEDEERFGYWMGDTLLPELRDVAMKELQ